MNLIPAKTPTIVKSLFPNFVWHVKTTDKVLYLTFDDGPTPEITNWVLHTLKTHNAKATFFCIGNNVQEHPDIFKSILNEGHTIGNHTFNHLKGWKTNTTLYIKEVQKTQDLFNRLTTTIDANTPLLFRPPYGRLKSQQSKQLHALGYNIVLWDVLSFDWDSTISEETCTNSVISNTKEGSIIVFHDSEKAKQNMMYALPKILKHFSACGYAFKSLDI